MFGLSNISGSCWVNTCLQAVFRIPDVQSRYNSQTFDAENLVDKSLCEIWNTKGEQGLNSLFHAIQNGYMPAGRGIGDSHELLLYLCDKLPFLDELVRFKMAKSIQCLSCDYKELKEDTVIEFSITSETRQRPIFDCIAEAVKESLVDTWKCEKCNKLGCKTQELIGTFPKVLMFHMIPTHGSINYSNIIILNNIKYQLISISCFNGGHWAGFGKNLEDDFWVSLNDRHVARLASNILPLAENMRVLIYYRLEN